MRNGMRLDRIGAITVHKMIRGHRKKRVPILMYHSITENVCCSTNEYFCNDTSPKTFEKHLTYIKNLGYEIVGLSALENECMHLDEGAENKKVIITFDDGYRDFYKNALPVLKDYGESATVFVCPGLVDCDSLFFKEKELMNWREINECFECGIEIGSHSMTHTVLQNLEKKKLEYELIASKKIIEEKLGTSVASFAYPYRFPEENKRFTKTLRNALVRAGYKSNVTTRIGSVSPNVDPYLLKRIPVNEFDDKTLLSAKLAGAYDWLHLFQLMKKMLVRG